MTELRRREADQFSCFGQKCNPASYSEYTVIRTECLSVQRLSSFKISFQMSHDYFKSETADHCHWKWVFLTVASNWSQFLWHLILNFKSNFFSCVMIAMSAQYSLNPSLCSFKTFIMPLPFTSLSSSQLSSHILHSCLKICCQSKIQMRWHPSSV